MSGRANESAALVRRILPGLVWPLAVLATALSAALWLRTFPADTIAVPIFGASGLSVLVSAAAVRLTRRSVLVTAPVAVVVSTVYMLTIVLRDPLGFDSLVDGFVHGPARLLSFALPLVSPLSLLVVPVALCWAVGAIAGESLARQRSAWLPYPVWLIGFAVSYAATARAYLDGGRSNRTADIALGAALLATLALLRIVQVWVNRDRATTPADGDNALPLRGVAAGVLVTALAVLVGAVAIQSSVVAGRPRAIQREPSVRQSDPVTPVAFVASLRPSDRTATGPTLFGVNLDHSAPPYISLASVDFYDGDSWSFERSFRPSGGVIPADVDPTLSVRTASVTQHYRLAGALTAAPWMPYLSRPERVSGQSVDVDAGSAMIVPDGSLSADASYAVSSQVTTTTFDQLAPTWLAATSPPPVDTQLPSSLRTTLTDVLAALSEETGTDSATPAAFLTAVVNDLRDNYSLTDPRAPTATASSASAPATASVPAPSGSAPAGSDGATTPSGTSFAAVLASILGDQRSGTPEQYATLVAIVARAVGIPARVVTGFRAAARDQPLTPGDHDVTASMAYTWVEVPVRDAGWVVVDPSPARYADSAARNTVGAQTSTPPVTSAPPTNNALVTQASNGQAVAPKSRTATASAHSWWLLLWVVPAALAGLAVLYAAGVLVGKATRRRRRRRPSDPRTQVVGAWHESLDTLNEAGLYGLTNLTGAEVTTSTEERFGVEPAGAVAVLSTTANRALFSEHSPIQPEDADAAWRANANLRRAVRQSLGLRARIGAALRYQRPGRHR